MTREGMRRRSLLLGTTSLVTAARIMGTTSSVRAQPAEEVLPKPESPFQGKIGRTVKDSTPDFPKGVEATVGAPNVLLILTDDVGFGATSTFGGPIQTPNFQRLADSGLRYNMYHTTALCSPTRAALIAGRNRHSVASGVITEFATGYPGYNSLVPKSAGSVGSVLKDNGYNTSWFGKMHNVPDWMSSQAGPFDLWPTGLGFEHFYGFLGGDSDQWHPALYDGTNPMEPYLGDPTYILDCDLAEKAIAWMRMQHALASNKPQKPIEGVSLVYTFDNATAPTQHGIQYFEMFGNRAIYKDGWMASTTPLRLPWVTIGFEPSPDDFKWELYNINEDFSQANNLVEKIPTSSRSCRTSLMSKRRNTMFTPSIRALRHELIRQFDRA
jgi:arylsulfatase A-like enzyme